MLASVPAEMHSAGEREVAGAPESNGEANDTATVPLGAVVSTMKVLPDKIIFSPRLREKLEPDKTHSPKWLH